MNFFNTYKIPWYDMGVIKVTMSFIGIYVGVTWPEFFEGWTNILLIIAIVGIVYLMWKYWGTIFS